MYPFKKYFQNKKNTKASKLKKNVNLPTNNWFVNIFRKETY